MRGWVGIGILLFFCAELNALTVYCDSCACTAPKLSGGQITVHFGTSITQAGNVTFHMGNIDFNNAGTDYQAYCDGHGNTVFGATCLGNPVFGGGGASFHVAATGTAGGAANYTLTSNTVTITYGGSQAGCGVPSTAEMDNFDVYIGSGFGCGAPVMVTGHWDSTPYQGSAVVNVLVGGILAQITCDQGGCNSGTIPAAQFQLINNGSSATVSYGVKAGSWDICNKGGKFQNNSLAVGAATGVSTIQCGNNINFTLASGCTSATPSPSPSASVAASPSPSPLTTPQATPDFTPPNLLTPPTNQVDSTVTNSGTTMSNITNQDIYNDVKQALDDAGNKDSSLGSATDGSFSYGNMPGGENGAAGDGLQAAVNRFTDDLSGSQDGLMGKVDQIDSLSLPTSVGDKSSWSFTLPILGAIDIDVSGYNGTVSVFRGLCLAILLIGTWFGMIRIIRSGVA